MLKRSLALLFIFVFLTGAFWQGQTYAPSGGASSFTPAWQSLKIGGGGLMNNIQVDPTDNTQVTSANTAGGYLLRTSGTCAGADNGGWGSDYAAPCYEQLFTQTSSPLSVTTISNSNALVGVAEIDTCHSNTNDAYAFFNNIFYVTTNLKAAAASRAWTATTLTTTASANQGVTTGTHSIIQCDPINPNIVWASNPTNLYVSANGLSGGSATFTANNPAVVGTDPTIIAYDGGSSAPTGTCSQYSGTPSCSKHMLAWVYGSRPYETYNGGSTWTITPSGGPTTPGCTNGCFSLRADQFGNFWTTPGGANIQEYVPNGTAGGGAWSTKSPSVNNSNVYQLAIDPSSTSSGSLRLAAAYADGNISVSTNGGSTWCSATGGSVSSSGAQPPWFANANQSTFLFLDINDLTFDTSGNLYAAAGIGNWQILSANVTCGQTWAAYSVGIENLVANTVVAPFGDAPVASTWDRAFWWMGNPDVFRTDYWPDNSYSPTLYGIINAGWGIDWAYNQPTFLAGWALWTNTVPASSSNGGELWAIWSGSPAQPTNFGGDIAVSTSSNWIFIPGASQSNIQYTTNGGASFSAATTTGMTANVSNGLGLPYQLASDKGTANTFCLIDGNFDVWASTNSGSTWTKSSTALEGKGQKFNDEIQGVPTKSGTFYVSGSSVNLTGGSSYSLYTLTKTTNECDTVTAVNANITGIFGYGFGAPIPGGNGFPTVFFYGAVSGTFGVYELDNGGTAPTLLTTWANNSIDFVKVVSGDLNVYGRVYVGFSGSGYAYYDEQNACPWVGWSNQLPGASLTGTVTLQAQHSGLVPATTVSFYVDGALIGSQTSGTGTPTTYAQSWVTGGVATGSHVLSVATAGNTTNNPNCTTSAFNGSISGSTLTVNSGTAPIKGQQIAYAGMPAGQPPIVISGSGTSFTLNISPGTVSSVNMVGSSAMFTIPITTH